MAKPGTVMIRGHDGIKLPDASRMNPSASKPYAGVFPIAPTPFTESGDLDIDGQRRVLDCMVDQGVDGICILANYSEQFLLTDAERDTLVDVCLSHLAGRVPVIVTCSHFSTRIAAERARKVPRRPGGGGLSRPGPLGGGGVNPVEGGPGGGRPRPLAGPAPPGPDQARAGTPSSRPAKGSSPCLRPYSPPNNFRDPPV